MLHVERAPLFVRLFLFLFSGFGFVLPFLGMAINYFAGKDFHFVYILAVLFFGLAGFNLLRLGLWNSFGTETLRFTDKNITYVADYGWFKDASKEIEIGGEVSFVTNNIKENKGSLLIYTNEDLIECGARLPLNQLEEINAVLETRYNSTS